MVHRPQLPSLTQVNTPEYRRKNRIVQIVRIVRIVRIVKLLGRPIYRESTRFASRQERIYPPDGSRRESVRRAWLAASISLLNEIESLHQRPANFRWLKTDSAARKTFRHLNLEIVKLVRIPAEEADVKLAKRAR